MEQKLDELLSKFSQLETRISAIEATRESAYQPTESPEVLELPTQENTSQGQARVANIEESTASSTSNAATTVLQATGLHRTYRMGRVEVPVLRGVDLQVQEENQANVAKMDPLETLDQLGPQVY